ncbi:MAG: hypothetical protein CVT73_01755 [Alphaproteobacteria bacterium HGW-Alphaproteobacteria-12]|nr:MAG: hypothetical protein CVT73_01755 [Alphaproteobacteria bacterium HGW-Alphaproteobacteria-12]
MAASAGTDAGKKLQQYWQSIRENNQELPHRSAFKITSAIAPILPFMVILEAKEMDVVFRLVGTGIVTHQGVDVTGKHYSDFTTPERALAAVARIGACHKNRCGFVSVHAEEYGRGLASEVEVTGLPLQSGDGGGQTMILAVIPTNRILAKRRNEPLFLRPATYFEFIDLGAGVPEDAAYIIKGIEQDDTRDTKGTS